MLKQRLQQKLLQKLSPQQIQLIKLLEIPIMQLDQRIKSELEENPALEEGADLDLDMPEDPHEVKEQDEVSFEEYFKDEHTPDYRLQTNNYSKDQEYKEIPFSQGSSFHESLIDQLSLTDLNEFERKLAEYIIGNIDDDGYLRRDISAIVDDLAFALSIEVDEEKLYEILRVIQGFDPAGVGAETLQECLLLQLAKKPHDDPDVVLAERIIKENFEEFTKKHYDKILAKQEVDEDELKDALEYIVKLNPKPGGSYSDPQENMSAPIIPDFILENTDGILDVQLNERNVPELRVSRTYAEMLNDISKQKKKSKTERETISFVKQKLDSAQWFIDAIQQRHNTLLVTMEAIIAYQKEYFLDGDEKKLKPMILKDIADATGLDISTISRVANSKHIQTDFGIFSLKSFFSESMQTTSGEEVSAREIKSILAEAVENENKRKPLTDDKLCELLNEKGYQIARRTVAKYREQLDIPVARLRKEL